MATEIEKELEKSAVEEGKEVEEKEKKIPVFTVLKNNSILKNIFLIDTPPDSLLPAAASSSSTTWMIPKDEKQEEGLLEEILVVGRHPDCNITVEHPSISRFHLRIHSIPSLESLSVIDLSSVHGTSVSGKKIEAGVQVKLNEGDTLRLGGSTRVYRLHWVPLSHAYDMKNPFVPPLDELEPVEQRAEQKPMHQDEDGLYPQDDQSYCVGDYFEDDRNQVSNLLREKKSANPAPRSLARSKAAILKVREDRVPFQSLLVNSSKTKSEASDPAGRIGSSTSGKNPQMTEATHSFLNSSEENRTWTMVVDTACLLDKESRKALQLMQGLQGTSLIIPRIVIRELDSMKRHSTLFKRTAGADSALQWIEESMVKAKWWIHVQSSLEDARPIAPTPRSIPLSESNEEKEKFSIGSIPYAPFGSLLDIVSPTTEDHVLECALFFRKIGNNGQLILLSNDVTLKIKAMAEGLRCETAEEFRESLVNPFSERFLWTASSPRGPTWSCLDDVVLREKYYNGPSRKQSKLEPAKGLKLILLHNSQYKQISSVS